MRAEASIDAGSPANGRGAASSPLLKTELLSVRFGGLAALSEVNFEVARDEIRAVIGPNGAGKSTFFNCLTGVLRPTGGRIVFNGEDITGLRSNLISQKGIARSYQITNILPNATTLENVRIAAQSRRHAWNMVSHHSAFADINGAPKPRCNRSACSARPTNWPPICRTANNAISKSALRSPPSRNFFAWMNRPPA